MQFAPPKRCGLEAEILGKITKSFNQVSICNLKLKETKYNLLQTPQPPPARGRVHKPVVQQSQIIVVSGDAIVDDTSEIEQEVAKQAAQAPQARSRKQDLGNVLSDESEKVEETAPPLKKAKVEPAAPVVSARPVRAAASKANSNNATATTATAEASSEDAEEEAEEEDEEATQVEEAEEDGGGDQAEDNEEEEEAEDDEESEASSPKKRKGRGRPPAAAAKADSEDNSPTRRSSRITRK